MHLERVVRPPHPVDVGLTLRPVRRGPGDPSMTVSQGEVWRATRTPDGPATIHLVATGNEVRAEAWGPGAAWAVDGVPDLIGCTDDDSSFRPLHPVLRDLHARNPGLRLTRTRAVFEAAVPTICEQKVLGHDARRSYHRILRTFGEPAPGPMALVVPPRPATLATAPYWAFHPFGLERRRTDTIRRTASVAHRLEEAVTMAPADAHRRLQAVAGLGAWSAAEIAMVALGDADAVPVGDFHLKHTVSWALAGEQRGTDERMLELLEPYRGHRGRVVRLLDASGITAPRHGPRLTPEPIADR